MSERTGLWAHRDFLRLWSAQAISAFGARITRTALPIIAVKTLGEPEALIALLMSLQQAPGLLIAPFTGGFVDRSRKRRILVAMDLVRAVVVGSLTIAWAFGWLGLPHVILVGMLVAASTAVFQITDVAYLPLLVGRNQVAEGNSKLEATDAVAEITGPASAGVLIAALGAPLAVIINTASYLWSAVMLGRIKQVETPPEPRPGASGFQTRDDLRVGMRAVLGHPQVRPVVLALAVWSIAGGFFNALYALMCLRTLQLDESTYGIIIAMGGIGALGGALASRRLTRSLGVGKTLIITSAISTTGALCMPLATVVTSHTLVLVLLASHQLVADGFAVAFVIQAVTLRQTALPKHVLGRANAAVLVFTLGSSLVATLVAGAIAQVTSIPTGVWIGVLVGMLVPIFVLPLRNMREMPLSPST
jgi:MFS family permease